MARWCWWMMHLLACICVWCSLNTNLFVVAGAPIIHLRLDSGNTTEGNVLSLVCSVNFENLERRVSSVALEWVQETMNTTLTLARAGESFNLRYLVRAGPMSEQLLIISPRKEDTGVYSCLALDLNDDNATLASAKLNVSVRYFPSTIDCFPNGSIAVSEGSTIGMSCTTEIGNPPVSFYIQDTLGISDGWTLSRTTNKQTLSLEREITSRDITYKCEIKSQQTGEFSGMERSCYIGPIILIPIGPTTTRSLKTTEPFTSATSTPTGLETAELYPSGPVTTKTLTAYPSDAPYTISLIPWITVSIISLILSTVSFVINIFILVRLMKRSNKEAGPAAIQPGVQPYAELQPRRIKSKSYTELMNQSVKEENETAEYDYPKLDSDNIYDDVQVQRAVQRQYRINKKVELNG